MASDDAALPALDPIPLVCMRCGETHPMRFYGLCDGCRAELVRKYDGRAHTVEVAEYEPTMHVTPNAVALRDD
jgi:hypothetical protein